MGKTAKIPQLIEILSGYGVATEEAMRRLDNLRAKFPSGDVPISLVQTIARQFLDGAAQAAILDAVTNDFLKLIQTGAGPIKRDDSALA